jgi:LPXTG-motif cell wall-anchored protein
VPSVPASTGSAPGTLARTGEDLPLSLIAIGALLLGAGFFLIGARRHRDREES